MKNATTRSQITKMRHDNKKLAKELKSALSKLKNKETELKHKDAELKHYEKMWEYSTREEILSCNDPSRLHTKEICDRIIHDKKKLHTATGLNKAEFDWLRDWVTKFVFARKDNLLFRGNEERESDKGNRCKLTLQNGLLLMLTHKRVFTTQDALSAFFEIDQSNVSRYLHLGNEILAEILPTAKNLTEAVIACKTAEERKKFLPGRNGGELIIDGTRTPHSRPEDKERQKVMYSGKVKKFSLNTDLAINTIGVFSWISDTKPGSEHDLPIAKQIGKDMPRTANPNIQDKNKIKLLADLGFKGIEKDLPGIISVQPIKKPKGRELTQAQKDYNKRISGKRVLVEHRIGKLKNYDILHVPYRGTPEEFNKEINIVTGLVNFTKLSYQIRTGTGPYGKFMDKKINESLQRYKKRRRKH